MKKIKLLTAGLLAMLAINVASAVTEIRITGSTAYRKAVVDSIERILQTGSTPGIGGYVWGSTTGSGAGANQQVFVGTTVGSNTQVIIKCSWSGSAGGIQSLASNLPAGQPFIIDPNTGINFGTNPVTAVVDATTLTVAGASIAAGDITESHTADVAMSDAFKESTPYTGAGFTALTSKAVGIVPFVWVGGAYSLNGGVTNVAGLYPGVSNITIEQAQELLAGGIQLNQLTGNSGDANFNAFVVGRDHDSGTRIATEYDSQFGQDIIFAQDTGYSEPLSQYIPNGAMINGLTAPFSGSPTFTQFESQSAGSGLITELDPWPSETVLGVTRAAGSEGFFSGSSVAGVLNRASDITNSGLYTIGYLGMSDAFTVNPVATGYTYVDGAGNSDTIKPSQNALTYGGVYPGSAAHPFGPPYVNIEQGVYPYWGIEHLLYQSSLAAPQLPVVTQIYNQIKTEADFGGVGDLLTNMTVTISSDGQQIAPGSPVGSP